MCVCICVILPLCLNNATIFMLHTHLHLFTTWRRAACVGSRLWKSTLQLPSTGNAGSHLHPQGQDNVICNT